MECQCREKRDLLEVLLVLEESERMADVEERRQYLFCFSKNYNLTNDRFIGKYFQIELCV